MPTDPTATAPNGDQDRIPTTAAVWKFAFTSPHQTFDMPVGAKVLTVAAQDNTPTLWALCDPTAEVEPRYFDVYGTGHPVPDPDARAYVGSAHGIDGWMVFHVFERVAA